MKLEDVDAQTFAKIVQEIKEKIGFVLLAEFTRLELDGQESLATGVYIMSRFLAISMDFVINQGMPQDECIQHTFQGILDMLSELQNTENNKNELH